MNQTAPQPKLNWDIFCRVIDNFGDVGVCWRLALNLAQRGQTVRLWVDDASALSWIAPGGAPGVQVLAWTTPFESHSVAPGEVLVEAFGCDIDPEFITRYTSNLQARDQAALWFNLEYLSAEDYVKRCHGLPSPVMSGPGRGLTKHFFYPGFTSDTGGLLREPDLLARQASFDRARWLGTQGIAWTGQRLVSLFCYEPAGLAALLQALAADQVPTILLVTPGRAAAALRRVLDEELGVQAMFNEAKTLSLFDLPPLSQTDFDHLLWACDLNLVRGEDSLVRALWAGKPLIWQLYPQADDAHHPKLGAFLDWLQAPPSLRQAHHVWNGVHPTPPWQPTAPLISQQQWPEWQATCLAARQRLLQQHDLVSQLLAFVANTP